MLTPPLRVKLQESPYLSLLRDQTFRAHLNGLPDPETTDTELHACAAGGAQLLLRGQIVKRAPGYQVSLTAWRCSDAKRLATQEARANSQVEILPALDTVAMQMRRRLGEPDDSLQKFNVPQVQATTGSFGALKAYSQGYEKVMRGHEADADSRLQTRRRPRSSIRPGLRCPRHRVLQRRTDFSQPPILFRLHSISAAGRAIANGLLSLLTTMHLQRGKFFARFRRTRCGTVSIPARWRRPII